MSNDSPPPSHDIIKQKTEELAAIAKWIAELIRSRNWFTLLLLVDAILILFFNPHFLTNFLKITLPDVYTSLFWFAVIIVFVVAVIIAVRTKPPLFGNERVEFIEPEAIKGLRAFTKDDAEIFSKLQRERSLQDCLNSITNDSFRFGILMGETGCGKTSFLQAGLLPKLATESATHGGVYVRFTNDEPITTIRRAFSEQLNLSKEEVQESDFLTVLSQGNQSTSKPLILIFDQFEQFFVHFKQKQDREPFFKILEQWYSASVPVKILFVIRNDLYYRMDELQRALGYSPGLNEVFTLEKFSPEEAVKILEAIAETERLEFDRHFFRELTEEQLVKQDGLISPVDLQILCWMIEKQKTSELRAFNRVAFLKLGGIEGLLTSFLEQTLGIITTSVQRQTAVKVLLALTDLERQLRVGILSLRELQGKLKGDVSAVEVQQAVNWLARGDVRLITTVEREGKIGYELAHEKLIPALTRLAGKELSDADKANQLLDRRVNEWLGNHYSSRYLFNFRELWLIQRQKHYLIWGSNRSQKERLLSQSRRRFDAYGAIFTVILLILVAIFSWFVSPWGQIYQINQGLELWSQRASYESVEQAAIAFAKDGNLKLALQTIDKRIKDADIKASAVNNIAEIYIKLGEREKAAKLLEKAEENTNKIQDIDNQVFILSSISQSYAKLNQTDKAIKLLEEGLKNTKNLQISTNKVLALNSITQAAAKLGKVNQTDNFTKLLEKIITEVNQIQDLSNKTSVLTSIANIYAKLNQVDKSMLLLKQIIKTTNQIQNSANQAKILNSIARVYLNLNQTDKAITLLEQAIKTTNQIQYSINQVSILNSIAETSVKLNQVDESILILEKILNTANQIQDSSEKARVLNSITEISTKLNSADKTIPLLEKILETTKLQEDSNKAQTLATIAKAYLQLEQTDKAIILLEQAFTASNQIQDANKVWILSSIIEVYGEFNQVDKVIPELEKILQTTSQITDLYQKTQILSSTAKAYFKLKQVDKANSLLEKALQTANLIQNSSDKTEALSPISETYAKLENWQQARNVIKKCPSVNCQVEHRARVLTIWAENKNQIGLNR